MVSGSRKQGSSSGQREPGSTQHVQGSAPSNPPSSHAPSPGTPGNESRTCGKRPRPGHPQPWQQQRAPGQQRQPEHCGEKVNAMVRAAGWVGLVVGAWPCLTLRNPMHTSPANHRVGAPPAHPAPTCAGSCAWTGSQPRPADPAGCSGCQGSGLPLHQAIGSGGLSVGRHSPPGRAQPPLACETQPAHGLQAGKRRRAGAERPGCNRGLRSTSDRATRATAHAPMAIGLAAAGRKALACIWLFASIIPACFLSLWLVPV